MFNKFLVYFRNTIVTVVERIDRRYRIVAPVHGWVSYKTTAGQIGLEAVELAVTFFDFYGRMKALEVFKRLLLIVTI